MESSGAGICEMRHRAEDGQFKRLSAKLRVWAGSQRVMMPLVFRPA